MQKAEREKIKENDPFERSGNDPQMRRKEEEPPVVIKQAMKKVTEGVPMKSSRMHPLWFCMNYAI